MPAPNDFVADLRKVRLPSPLKCVLPGGLETPQQLDQVSLGLVSIRDLFDRTKKNRNRVGQTRVQTAADQYSFPPAIRKVSVRALGDQHAQRSRPHRDRVRIAITPETSF